VVLALSKGGVDLAEEILEGATFVSCGTTARDIDGGQYRSWNAFE